MLQHIRPAVVLLVLFTVLTGLVYPLAVTGDRAARAAAAGERQPDREGRRGRRLGADRAELQDGPLLPPPSVGDDRHRPERFDQDDRRALQRRQFLRLEPRADVARSWSTGSRPPSRPGERGAASGPVPADAVTTSASGLDPDISPRNALAQAPASPRRAVSIEAQGACAGGGLDRAAGVRLDRRAAGQRFAAESGAGCGKVAFVTTLGP